MPKSGLVAPAAMTAWRRQRPRKRRQRELLRGIVEAGYGDRVMFGSDQMVWPGLIDAAVRSIQEAPFLTANQKRDIFYNNAARFLLSASNDNQADCYRRQASHGRRRER